MKAHYDMAAKINMENVKLKMKHRILEKASQSAARYGA